MDTMSEGYAVIDFETATYSRASACAVGIVTVEKGEIVEEFYSLIQPPQNHYYQQCIEVHGIQPSDTAEAPPFSEVYPEIANRLMGKTVVAHNEAFDRSVLKASAEHSNLPIDELELGRMWECTLKIYRAKGFNPCRLSDCCTALDIELDHHHALSDARACAELYLRR